jgi:SAM-dependent methyltransferase
MYRVSWLDHNWFIKQRMNDFVRQCTAGLAGVVIDLGCGTAPFRHDILEHASTYYGVDWGNTPHASKADVIADLNRTLPFVDEVADHVVSFEVIEHLSEPATMLREAARILRPNGTLTLSAPFQWWEHESPWDYQRFTRHGLEYQLGKAGFSDITVRPTTGFWSMWILKLNYQLARLLRGPRALRLVMRLCLVPIWWIGQVLAPLLDRAWPEERETAGYFVSARKP